MNIKTVMWAKKVTEHLEEMFVPLHRLAYPKEGSYNPEIREIFNLLAQARSEALVVFSRLNDEVDNQMREINGPE